MKTPAPSFLSTLLIRACLLTLVHPAAHAATLTLNATTFRPGDAITASFADHSGGSSTDWIGVYPDGVVPTGDPAATSWGYVDGTQASGSADLDALATGTFELNNAYLGNWTVHFLSNNGYGAVAGTVGGVNFTVAPSLGIGLVADKASYEAGETIRFDWSGNDGFVSTDWIGIYRDGETPGVEFSTAFQYTSGTDGNLSGFDSLSAGDYDAYLLANDGYTVLAETSFSVVPEPSTFLLCASGLLLVRLRRRA
ncbi:hypothetical protein [Haloferula rosea]|uniref:PEP-CTERM protein-sorting domain-containing protein n=1 Tax=Haloferula rosea TaxID=490093 RepID=A0A934RC93_9BACT|nr:hypothetical protein [Haloferula rosea]MBK1826644.1 hypothetical protein [Haloferula rosea]